MTDLLSSGISPADPGLPFSGNGPGGALKPSEQAKGPIVIRGVEYASYREAAEAFGLALSYVQRTYENGRGDRIGTGPGYARSARQLKANAMQKITIRGVDYASEEAVAAALGVTRKTVQRALRKGRGDYIGIPPHKTRCRTGSEPLPVMIRGTVYKSAADAAKAFGLKLVTIFHQVSLGRADYIGLGRSRRHAKRPIGKHNGQKPISIGKLNYPSRRAASEDLGITENYLYRLMREGNTARLMTLAMKAEARRTTATMKLMAAAQKAEGPGVEPKRAKVAETPLRCAS